MKILILTTGNPFTPSMLYKENYLIKAAQEAGDEVVVFASEYTYTNGVVSVAKDHEEVGFRLKRFKYHPYGPEALTSRIRRIDNLEEEIINERPDLIFVNCAQVYNLKNLRVVKKALPNVKIVLDYSTKFLNSARNWLSKNILHKLIYRNWVQKALNYVDRVFYISQESKEFAQEMYKIPEEIMEHNNLPGETIAPNIKKKYKTEIFKRLNLSADNILILYSGKIYAEKKVDNLVRAFSRTNNPNLRLLIIGVYTEDSQRAIIEPIIDADKRITFMDFVSGDELTKYVCAADLYMQPGSISQTCQTAVCCGTPLAFNDIPTHREIYNGNGFFVESEEDIVSVFNQISDDKALLPRMSALSYEMAAKELDFHIIYAKILKAVGLSGHPVEKIVNPID